MRKVLSLILVGLMALSMVALSACTENNNTATPSPTETKTPANGGTTLVTPTPTPTPTPAPTPSPTVADISVELYKLIKDGADKTMALSALDVSVREGYTEDDGEFSYSEKDLVNIKIEDIKSKDSQFAADGYSEVDGERSPMYLAYVGGYFYVQVEDVKMKLTQEELETVAMLEENPLESIREGMSEVMTIPSEDCFKNATVKAENGNKTVEITMTGEEFEKQYGKYCESVIESVAFDCDVKSSKFYDVKIVITVNAEGYIVYYSVDTKLDISYDLWGEGEYSDSKVTASSVMEFKNIGEKPEIKLPDDADSYLGVYELYLEQLRAMDWSENAGMLDWNYNSWDEFIEGNSLDEENFSELMGMIKWEDFKEIVLEDLDAEIGA